MGKTTWIVIGVIILLLVAGYFLFSGDESERGASGTQAEVDQATAQVIDTSIVAEEDDVEIGEVIE